MGLDQGDALGGLGAFVLFCFQSEGGRGGGEGGKSVGKRERRSSEGGERRRNDTTAFRVLPFLLISFCFA